jgi:serine/threonine protein kinase
MDEPNKVDVQRVSFAMLTDSTHAFSTKLGEGATGAVYRGEIRGEPVAIKRLKLAMGATPENRATLEKAFRAELTILSTFRHPRLVRLDSFAIDTEPASQHPFALVFELLTEGSLADHLRGSSGAPAEKAVLSALERIDCALGAAAGIAYLHGLRDAGDGAGAQAGAPTLHRDIKSANIGLTRNGGGALHSKVLDCGLAKALALPGAASGSSTTHVVGTTGYMVSISGMAVCVCVCVREDGFLVILSLAY